MNLTLSRLFIFMAIVLFSVSVLGFSTTYAAGDSTTVILEELPGIDNAGFKAALQGDRPGEVVGYYINGLLTLGIGLATVLAVLMITIGGFQYITTDSFTEKSDGKERIQYSLMGLGLILVSYLLLGTINSDLLKIRFGLSPTSLQGQSINTQVNIEDTITAAVRENNAGVPSNCKRNYTGSGNNTGLGPSFSMDASVRKINKQIRELQGYKEEAKDKKKLDKKTHVLVENIYSKDPDGSGWGDYDHYEPIEYKDSNFENDCKDKGIGQCVTIEAYDKFMDRLISKLEDLKSECEAIYKNSSPR